MDIPRTRAMLQFIQKDRGPTNKDSKVVYEFSSRCEARYVGRTCQRLKVLVSPVFDIESFGMRC